MRAALGLLAVLVSGGAQGATMPVVVELFTSQGCSSCPPADEYLTELSRQRGDVLALALHVTYWDNLGWKDPFSLPAATERQNAYAQSLGTGQVYTPQMVVNGSRDFIGSRRGEGSAAIARAASEPGERVSVSLVRDGDTVKISVGAGAGHARILLVGFDSEHQTHVGRGENSGRALVESNIVRVLLQAGAWTGPALTLQRPAPAGEQVAVLIQAEDGKIIGAASTRPNG